MIDVTSQCTTRLEVNGLGQVALVYLHLAKNDGESRDGAIGFFNLDGFHQMDGMEKSVSVTKEDIGWFKVEVDTAFYLSHFEKWKEANKLQR